MRFVSVAGRPIPSGPCGGGRGVSYRLMKANERYRLFDDTLFIFSDKCIDSSRGEIVISSTDPIKQHEQLKQLYKQLDKVFEFNKDDCFVFHDVESFCAMKDTIPWLERSLVVYHQQGSIYSEHLFFGNEPDEAYEKLCFDVTKHAIEQAHFFTFPSHGAKQALVDTLPEIGQYLGEKPEIILYNGCSPSISRGTPAIDGLLEMLKQLDGEVFITVAALNEAKGVELLPQFFREYGRLVEDYFWIVIGNGPKRNELSKGIEDLEGHVLWIEGYLDNNDVIRLYDVADYYIMAHRFSIFDYATIEAMHMGCIPLLSPVGGNLEMITHDNGYYLDESLNAQKFITWRNGQDIERLKELNRKIAGERFSEYSMLKAYHDIVMDL